MPKQQQDLNYLQRYLVEEAAEDFQHGQLTRRQALKMIAGVLGSVAAASAFLAACAPAASPSAPASSGAAPGAAATLPPAAVSATAAPASPLPTAAATAPSAAVTAAPTAAQVAQATQVATQAVITTTATVATRPAPVVPAGVRVSPDDPAIEGGDVQFPGQGGVTLVGYQAKPKGAGPFPIVLVCHENRGLTDHIKDVTRRAAKAGYAALAVDLLSREGGTAKITDQSTIPGLLGKMSMDQMVQDFQSGLRYMQGQPFANKDRAGMVGFCFGGGVTWLAATRIPELRAAVPFYGPNPPLADVPKIQAAVLAFYGALDQRIDAGIPAIEKAMADNHKTFEKVIYPGANHAFHNDTGPNYNPQAATDAWAKTIAWFDKYLKGS
jgi:carboxymethylenebutenolidase